MEAIPQLRNVLLAGMVCCMTACVPPTSDAPIITKYKAAACIPLSGHPKIRPPTREWDNALSLRDGSEVIVSGAQVPGGRITVSYSATGRTFVAADPGDYVYPSDVRIDAQNDLLYIKGNGFAGGISEQTWLFEYDLHEQRIKECRQVKNGILPAECPERSSPQ
jgi:hypothetical protein